MPGRLRLGVVAQAPPPKTGSTTLLTALLPPLERRTCAAAARTRISPGCSAAHVRATNGPPEGAAFGHVCVSAVTSAAGLGEPPLT